MPNAPARDLSFDFQVFPDQFGNVGELAAAHPGMRCCIVHAGMLTATDASTVEHWRRALESLVPLANVFIKVSGLNTFARVLELEIMRIAIEVSLELFGPDRCFYGSNFPVEKLWTTYDAYSGANKAILAGRPRAVQQKFFHDTAAAFYRSNAAPSINFARACPRSLCPRSLDKRWRSGDHFMRPTARPGRGRRVAPAVVSRPRPRATLPMVNP